MGHKVHPEALRIQLNKNWRVRFLRPKAMPVWLSACYWVEKIIKDNFPKGIITEIIIESKRTDVLDVLIKSPKVGLVLGREGRNLKALQSKIESKIKEIFEQAELNLPALNLKVEELKKPYTCAQYLAEIAAIEIEKRLPVRTVLKRTIKRARQHKEILGIKVKASGRLNGAEIHRTETLSEGTIPLSTLRQDIEYGFAYAKCTYGIVGVKVWLNKGEKENYLED